jgi:hypothetical protein
MISNGFWKSCWAARLGALALLPVLILAAPSAAAETPSPGLIAVVEEATLDAAPSLDAYHEARLLLSGGIDTAPEGAGRPSPRGAVLRSLAIPGWGQLYNGQPLKIPFVIGGLGALASVAVHSNNRAVLFRRAAIYHDCLDQPERVPPGICDGAGEYAEAFQRADALTGGPLTGDSARRLRDNFRRQRDLFAVLTALGYGLQALDAYVAAELDTFDVGEDLAVAFTAEPGLALRWRF